MTLYRKLHTRTLESLDVNEMPDDFTRVFWLCLPLVTCREGRGIDRPQWLRSRIFPMRTDVTDEMLERGMTYFHARGMILRYPGPKGCDYYQIVNWRTYQGNTSRERQSPYPPPPAQHSGFSGSGAPVSAPASPPSPHGTAHDPVPTGSRPSQEPLTTYSRLDADADTNANTDAKAKKEAAVQAQKPAHTPGPAASPPRPGAALQFPESLDSPRLRQAWAEWEQYQRERGEPLSPSSRKKQLLRAAAYSVPEVCWLIDYCVEKGWRGLQWKYLDERRRQGTRGSPHIDAREAERLNDLLKQGAL